MMKHIKTIAALFIALVAMSSCSKDETPDNSQLAKKLVGEWIMEHDIEGLELLVQGSDIEIPAEADMYTVIYHFNTDGYGWQEIAALQDGMYVATFISRYGMGQFSYEIDNDGNVYISYIDDDELGDVLTFDGNSLSTVTNDQNFNLVRATGEQIAKYNFEAETFHGGNAEDDTIETGIGNKDASEPSRARQL
jgi:hypothetical protein